MNTAPIAQNVTEVNVSKNSSSKASRIRIFGLLAVGILVASGLFTILAKPQLFAAVLTGGKNGEKVAESSDLIRVGAVAVTPTKSPKCGSNKKPCPTPTPVLKPDGESSPGNKVPELRPQGSLSDI